jgi:hypothetical protein
MKPEEPTPKGMDSRHVVSPNEKLGGFESGRFRETLSYFNCVCALFTALLQSQVLLLPFGMA